jgi:hypothetical protein
MLPAVVGLEALAETACILSNGRPVVAFRDVKILNGLRFFSDRPATVRVSAIAQGQDIACEMVGDFVNRQGRIVDPNRVYMTGRVETTVAALPPKRALLTPPADGWHPMRYPDAAQAAKLVYHGEAFRRLQALHLGPDGGHAQIVGADASELSGTRSGGWIVPAAVLDSCVVSCAVFAKEVLGILQLPEGFDSLQLIRAPRPGENCLLHFQYRGKQSDRTSFDFSLVGDDDHVILLANGHRCVALLNNHRS